MQLSLVSLALTRIYGGSTAFSPLSLFAAGEKGVWYDPSDMSTMFTVSSGGTPVTATNQPVGLILNKASGAPNIFTSLPVMVCDATVSQSGNILTFASSPALAKAQGAPPIVPTNFYRMSFEVIGTGAVQVSVGLTTRVFSQGVYLLESWNASGTTTFIVRAHTAGFNGTFEFRELLEYKGPHATQATAASRPLYKTDGTHSWLEFDGIDDSLSTTAIDFTANNSVSIFAGTIKLSTTYGVILETSTSASTNNGAFLMYSYTDSKTYFGSRGDTTYVEVGGNVIGTSIAEVVSGLSTISAPPLLIRENGVQTGSVALSQGTGNYGNYPLYIGSRAGSSLPFNGQLYSLIIRGASSTPIQITNTETWVNSKIGAY